MTRKTQIAVLCCVLTLGPGTTAATDTLLPEQMNEEQLRVQLEHTRALNAELDAERKRLEAQLQATEAQVATGKRELDRGGIVTVERSWWHSPLADAALIVAGLLAVAGLVGYGRHRSARNPG